MNITLDNILENKIVRFIYKILCIYFIDYFSDIFATKIDYVYNQFSAYKVDNENNENNVNSTLTTVIYYLVIIILTIVQLCSLIYIANLGTIESILSIVLTLIQRKYTSIFGTNSIFY